MPVQEQRTIVKERLHSADDAPLVRRCPFGTSRHSEFIKILPEDAEELHPFEKRITFVPRLLEHATLKGDQAQVAIERRRQIVMDGGLAGTAVVRVCGLLAERVFKQLTCAVVHHRTYRHLPGPAYWRCPTGHSVQI